jgi:membrane-associated phospholipid phosphatase
MDGEVIAKPLVWTSRMVEWPYWLPPAVAGALYGWLAAGGRITVLVPLAFVARYLNYPVLKELAGRPRPSPEDVEVERALPTLSFPSGHAYNAVILYGLIFFLAALYVRPKWVRRPVEVLCVLVISGTGLERVYHGYHWPSDVAGGYLSGALVLALLVILGLWLTGRLSLPGSVPAR